MASVAPGPPEGPGYTLQVVCLASGEPGPLAGWYVASYQPEQPAPDRATLPQLQRALGAVSDHCHLVLLPGREGAHVYATAEDAWAAWRAPCHCQVVQPGGEPCRPLVAYTCAVQALPRG